LTTPGWLPHSAVHMPAETAIPEELLRAKLLALVDSIVDRMLACGAVETGLLPLIAGAAATIAVLDARQQSNETPRR
jgi:hypothetical protein